MTDRPILFSAPMVRALLEGRKTMTRRLAWKPNADGGEDATPWHDLYMEWQFRPVGGFFDYLAGRDGLVYSLKGGQPPKALSGTPSSKGYLTVSLCGPDGIKTRAVHRVIAEAWFGPQMSQGMEVRHLNGDRTDNRIENLDWGTATENWSDRRAQGNGIHEAHHAAKITMASAEAIRSSPLSQRKLAAQFGVTQSTIWQIKQGHIWVQASPASGRNIALPMAPRLWVRESGHVLREAYDHDPARGDLYRDAGFQHTADGAIIARRAYDTPLADWIGACARANRPSIHMPRWASRLTLTVTAVRVEPLQDINAGDAIREGIAYPPKGMTMDEACEYGVDPRGEFRSLWAALHGPGAWAANPEVVALTFTVARRNIDHG